MTSYTPVNLAFNCIEPEECSKDLPPIIFMHGVTGSKELWNDIPQIVANTTKRKAYVVDARNHGDSPWSDVFNFDCTVDDLLLFMDTINAPSAILIGHSMGGVTAIKTALKAPERVEKVVAEDINMRKPRQEIISLIVMFLGIGEMAIQHVSPEMDETTAKKFISDYVFNIFPKEIADQRGIKKPENDDVRIQLKKGKNGRYEYKSNYQVIKQALKNAPALVSDYSGDFKGPSCFIYGANSPVLVGADKDHIKEYFPHTEFVAIENSGHTPHNEQPKEFTEALLKFLLEE